MKSIDQYKKMAKRASIQWLLDEYTLRVKSYMVSHEETNILREEIINRAGK